MKHLALSILLISVVSECLNAQVCDPSVEPSGLTSTYTPGTGALLEWDAVPGSVGVQLKVDLPSGSVLTKRIGSFELDQFFIPEVSLSAGTYTWRVQAACSPLPPFDVTPISANSSFTVGGGSSCPATVTDVDGNVYSTVEIGSQCWMKDNLKVEHYRNGDAIPTGLSNLIWGITTNGAFAAYSNLASNKATYGLLYNSYSTVDPRGLCLSGWHVPTDTEWTQLTDFLGGATVAGGDMKTTGTLSAGTGLWYAPNTAATNSSGFSGLPGGCRLSFSDFLFQGYAGYWWSSSESSAIDAWFRLLDYEYEDVFPATGSKRLGLSVRCVQD